METTDPRSIPDREERFRVPGGFDARRARVRLHRPAPDDGREFVDAVRASRDLHRPWTHAPDTIEAFEHYLGRNATGDVVGFLIRRRSDRRLVGVANLSGIVHRALHSAYLGYYGFAGGTGGALMSEGVALVVRHAFRELGLHRVEANVQPGNERSLRLVRRLGFSYEGYSRRYLRIGGEWRDHERWAMLREDWEQGRPVPRDPDGPLAHFRTGSAPRP